MAVSVFVRDADHREAFLTYETVAQQELPIASVGVFEHLDGLLVRGQDNVAHAVNFAWGRFVDNLALDGQQMLSDLPQRLGLYGRWDNATVGEEYRGSRITRPELKVTRFLGDENYILYVRNVHGRSGISEEALGEELGLERGLVSTHVNIAFNPQGENFVVDFNKVLEILDKSLNLQPQEGQDNRSRITGEDIATHFLRLDKNGRDNHLKPFILMVDDGIQITVNVGLGGYVTEAPFYHTWDGERAYPRRRRRGGISEDTSSQRDPGTLFNVKELAFRVGLVTFDGSEVTSVPAFGEKKDGMRQLSTQLAQALGYTP